jgi:hypothetical protein
MSLRSKIIDYYLDEDNELNPEIDVAVHSIVESDIRARTKFEDCEPISRLISFGHVAMSILSKLVDPESKANFEEEEEVENLETKLLLEEHANTREVLVDSFFEDGCKRSASLVKMYCNDDLRKERGTSWKLIQPKLTSFAMKTLVWYGEFAMSLIRKRGVYNFRCNEHNMNSEKPEFQNLEPDLERKNEFNENLGNFETLDQLLQAQEERKMMQNEGYVYYNSQQMERVKTQELPPLSDLLEELKGEELSAQVANTVLSE